MEQASDIVLALRSQFRLPDGLRRADHISRQALQRSLGARLVRSA